MACERGQRCRPQSVEDVPARWLRFYQSGLAQYPQATGQVRLPGAGQFHQMTGAQLLAGEQLDDPRSERVGQRQDQSVSSL